MGVANLPAVLGEVLHCIVSELSKEIKVGDQASRFLKSTQENLQPFAAVFLIYSLCHFCTHQGRYCFQYLSGEESKELLGNFLRLRRSIAPRDVNPGLAD